VGGSIAEEDIFGLRDIRTGEDVPPSWQAIWKEKGRCYRLWMLSQVHSVQVSNGPGQQTWDQIGRRVRYLDAIRTGRDLSSTFVTIHEPSGPRGSMPIGNVVRLGVPRKAGPDALALRIESQWGIYRIFNRFCREAEVDGVRFKGVFGILCEPPEGARWLLTSGASTLTSDTFGFEDTPASWSGEVIAQSADALITRPERPVGWARLPEGITNYVLVKAGKCTTGFPLRSTGRSQITVERFPLPPVSRFSLAAIQYQGEF
jgi:hypothetical protein